MSRSIPVWLLASGLVFFAGCGGGEATDSGTVASKSDAGSAGTGTTASMSAEPSMAMPGGDMSTPDSASMGTPSSADMNAEMYAAAGDPAAMAGGTGTDNAAAMAAAYAASESANTAAAGASPEDMAAAYAAGAEGAYPGTDAAGAYPGGVNPAGPGGEVAYPGGAYPGGPGGAVEEKVPDGFDGKAQLAFRRGKEKDAMQYLYAHALTTDAGAENLLPTIRWVSGLREPRLAVRWGVGFVVTAPRNFAGDPKPVGSQQTLPTRDNRKGGGGNEGYVGGGGGTEYGAGGGAGGGGSNSLLEKGAGELGEKLAAAYTERVAQGDFGEVLKTALEQRTGGNRGEAGGAGYGAGAMGYGATPGNEGGAGAGGAAAAAALATQVTQIMPGLSMLGIGSQKELIERAREDGIDAVVIIDVKIRVNTTNNLVTNDSTIALLDAKTQKKLHTTKTFNNIKIQTDRAANKEDGVDKELEELFAAIDENFKMTDLPAGLNADIAGKRVAALVAEKTDNPLPVLAEVRMYHAKGLLDETALFAAYEQILDVDSGRLLATGTEEDKAKALAPWLPEN